MSLPQGPPGSQRHPRAIVFGPSQTVDVHAQWILPVFALNVVGDKAPRTDHTRHGAQTIFQIRGHAGNLSERSARAALHHPQVRPDAVHHHQRVVNHAPINPAHAQHSHQQETDAHGRQGEPPEVVADVFGGEVHFAFTR